MPDALIHFTGNLGDAPEMRYTPNGVPVASASVAVNKSKKVGNTGDPKQDYETLHTTWYRVSWWRELAEAVAQMNLVKGQTVTVDGEVYEEEWTSRDGKTGKSLVVTATGVRPYPKRDGRTPDPSNDPQAGQGGDPWAGQQDPSAPPF